MINDTQVTFTGWVGGEVTVRELSGGRVVATFRAATTPRRFRDGSWADGPTTWHTVKAWDRLARHVAESVRPGQPVVVHGRLVAETWTRPDGAAVTSYAVVAGSVGHDLNHGASDFRRAVRVESSEPSEPGESDVSRLSPPAA